MSGHLGICALFACAGIIPCASAADRTSGGGASPGAVAVSETRDHLVSAHAVRPTAAAPAHVTVEYVRAPVRGYMLRPNRRSTQLAVAVPRAAEQQEIDERPETSDAVRPRPALGSGDFAAERFPRHRRSPLDTMLTLRMSGETGTRLSLGGGVAGALWRAMPRN